MLNFRVFTVIMLCCVVRANTFAQEDSLFNAARELIYAGKLAEARPILARLIEKHPENTDFALMMARSYLWQGDADSAVIYLEPHWRSTDFQTFDLALKVCAAAKDLKGVEKLNAHAAKAFPDSSAHFLYYRAVALSAMERNDEALRLIDSLRKKNGYRSNLAALKTTLLRKKPNQISAGYLNTSFRNPGGAPWHFAFAEYQRKLSGIGIVGRINYATLYGFQSMQAEADLYPKIGKKGYLFLNGGYAGKSTIFPEYRMGAEYFREDAHVTCSAGARYLQFTSEGVLMFTGHAGYVREQWKLTYRPFAVLQKNDWFLSHVVGLRRELRDFESYVQLDLQYGNTPYYFYIGNDFQRISAYRAGVNCKLRAGNHFFIQPVLMYELEEFVPGKFRDRYNVQLILSLRF